jgi:hypothetical protein
MADIDYLRRVVLKVKNWNDLARVMQERKPKLSPAPKKVEAPEPEKKAESFDSLLSNLGKNPAITDPPKPLPETPKRQPIPATQVCGPDHWQKDHWEPSCK